MGPPGGGGRPAGRLERRGTRWSAGWNGGPGRRSWPWPPLATLAAGCGSGTARGTVSYVAAGQIPRADVPHLGGHGKKGSTTGTIPLAKENTTTALFTALGDFQACLSTKGVTFIGAPNPSDPSSPANNPNYLKALETCAAQSKILQALKAEQTAQENLTPTQVKKENRITSSGARA